MSAFAPKLSYTTGAGYGVYYQDAVNKRKRTVPLNALVRGTTIYLIAHFTEAVPTKPTDPLDSRSYLWSPSDGRVVSATYLAGIYPDTGPKPVIYKYASETYESTYTQGYGLMGQFAQYDHANQWISDILYGVSIGPNLNDIAIGYEIEANATPSGMPVAWLLNCVTAHIAEIMSYWHGQGLEVVLLGHKHVDSAKQDPQLDWTAFDHQVKGQLQL